MWASYLNRLLFDQQEVGQLPSGGGVRREVGPVLSSIKNFNDLVCQQGVDASQPCSVCFGAT